MKKFLLLLACGVVLSCVSKPAEAANFSVSIGGYAPPMVVMGAPYYNYTVPYYGGSYIYFGSGHHYSHHPRHFRGHRPHHNGGIVHRSHVGHGHHGGPRGHR